MEYICKHCNKIYKSCHSRSNHYRIYHNIESKSKVSQMLQTSKSKVSQTIFNCNFCNRIYKHKQSKYKHEQICKNKELKDNNKIVKLEKENLEIKNELNKINELLKLCKIHPKTLQKINNQLINKTNNGSINNGFVNSILNTFIISK